MFERGDKAEIHKGSNTKKLLIVASITIVVLAAVAGYFIWRTISLDNTPAAKNEQKSLNIVEKVGKIYEAPNEEPTVAEISDKEKLKDQTFFAKAENGDYLLVYTNEKMALIYRDGTNKIINAGPVSGAK